MTVQVVLYILALVTLTPLLGNFMPKVFTCERHIMKPVFGWREKLIYQFSGVGENEETDWKSYTFSLLVFNFFGFLVVFILQLFRSNLPYNPQHLPNVSWHLSFNTAVSFMTNTYWQS